MRLKSIYISVMLLIIFVFSVFYRIRLNTNPEYYDPRDPTAFYWTENALQYHYAELIANGKSIPAYDSKLQAPEGVKIFENLTILMEYPCGWLYRLLRLKEKNILFHTWTISYIAICASLGIFAIYLLCQSLGINYNYSILAGALLSFSLVSVGRSTFGFLNEDFALPFFILGLAGYLYAIKKPRYFIIFSMISGGCFLISLCSWHFSRFMFLALISISILNIWIFEKGSRIKENAMVIFYTLVIPFIGSLIVPVLRSRLYFLSIPFAFGLGAVLGIIIFYKETDREMIYSRNGWLAIATGLLFFLASILFTGLLKTETEYIHVWSLIINKIKFLGVKPSEPEVLDYPARSLWIEAFNSPHLVVLFKNLFPVIIPAIFGFVYLLKKQWGISNIRLFLLLSIIFFLSFLAIERMGVVNNYFIVGLAISPSIFLTKRRDFYKYLFFIGLIIIILFNFYQGYHLHNPTGYIKRLRKLFGSESGEVYNWRLNNVEVVRYIKFKTPENSIFLSSFGVGPLIFTYAQRAIVLQPKFEVKGSQKLVKDFFDAIYNSEENFYNLCKKWKVNYFLYDVKILLDNSTNGARWIAGKTKIHQNSSAFLMHYFPQRLKHFQLVYQNSFYRLYRVLSSNEIPVSKDFLYQPIYDLKTFGNQSEDAEFFDDRFTKGIIDRLMQAKVLLQKANSILIKDPNEACRLMNKSIELYPSLIGSLTTMGIASALAGRVGMGIAFCQKEVEANPLYPAAHYNLAYCLYLKGDITEAINELKETLLLEPNFTPAQEMLRQLQE